MNQHEFRERVAGGLLGLALGDACGRLFEGGPPARLPVLEPLGRALTYTDDTEMALGVAEALLHDPDIDREFLAQRFVARHTPSRRYGFGVRRWVEMVAAGASWAAAARAVFPEGSFGNGAAMRVAPVGLRHPEDAARRRRTADRSAEVTHQHPLGRAGAVVLADAVAFALLDRNDRLHGRVLLETLAATAPAPEFRCPLEAARNLLARPFDPHETIERLGNDVTALRSVPTAVYLACRHSDDFEAALRAACELGGDADTIGAMTSAIVGTHVGRAGLPQDDLLRLEHADQILELADLLAEAALQDRA